jgi:hypothetical protein
MGGPAVIDRPLVLSSSAVSAYLRCGHRYLLAYVYRIAGAQNMAAAIGQAVHAGVEALHRGQPAEDALRAAFWHEVESVPAFEVQDDPGALEDALRMLNVYREEVLPTFHPTLVEVPFAIMVEDVVLTGVFDGADDDVRDLKTTAGKTINGKKPNFSPENYDMQLAFYDLGYRGLTGRRPKRLILDVLTRRGTYRQYIRPPKIGEAIDSLRIARDGINREEFEPTGALSGACRWCPFATKGCSFAVLD